ncbi:copper homeostasis periplasmic binding protein CopC [Crenobacter sp. SG2303]|uniref:Copper homeostasis periplasmic binding protein CopC n=1 Tax=Crenobacter oryzisoli TaxID=3056844 RepID=A0ABT7XSV2_9NEIS|nr:copper homeostasis periplasmic binding protein CopC [Crenobacter sp. SG2303]MDN0076877.1 copper homeostasis periplasmic binding protein CopC [Crenobacter sp. SG2303]
MKPLRKMILSTVLLLTCAAPLALAHAHPKQLSPQADVSVAAPKEIRIAFSESLEPALSSIKLFDAKNKLVTDKSAVDKANPKVMALPLPALAGGQYRVEWVAVAEDGHRTSGHYRFTVK